MPRPLLRLGCLVLMPLTPLMPLSMLGAVSCSSSTAPSTGTSSSGSAGSAGSSGTDPSTDPTPTTTLFTKAVTSVTVEIDYATGAAPFMGAIKNYGDPWTVLPSNADAIFDGKKKVTIPTTLAQMQELTDVTATTFTKADVLAIAAAHRDQPAGVSSFYIVFVNGTYVDDAGTPHDDTLGVSIGQTGVIAMFKPAIGSALVEQLALVHQLGHAVGFVDNGVPVGAANSAHVDTANVHHCTRAQCALDFDVESAAGAKAFAAANMHDPSSILIGQECLSDARILENAE